MTGADAVPSSPIVTVSFTVNMTFPAATLLPTGNTAPDVPVTVMFPVAYVADFRYKPKCATHFSKYVPLAVETCDCFRTVSNWSYALSNSTATDFSMSYVYVPSVVSYCSGTSARRRSVIDVIVSAIIVPPLSPLFRTLL